MDRPKIEDFKPEYTKGVAEIASVAKQYVKAQEEYIDYLEGLAKNCSIPDVSNRRELYFAFMKEYNALMGESEHQILKEEVEVLLAKYSC